MTMLKFEKFSATSQQEPVGGITSSGSLVIRDGDGCSLINTNGNISHDVLWKTCKNHIETFIYKGEYAIIKF